MNELQRQHYLSALGIDTYMPRWQLPFAPASLACELPTLLEVQVSKALDSKIEPSLIQPAISLAGASSENITPPLQTSNLLNEILDSKKSSIPTAQPISAADILAQLNTKPASIEGFSLSIWRPLEGVMIVDARNTKLALPTELLLNNILRSLFSNQSLKSQEEILKWPMIENSFTKRTANDARIELQTWLSVQHEIRPVQYLWLMGSNAACYLLPDQTNHIDLLFQPADLADSNIKALILPSLNEILQNPILKQTLFAATRRYHSPSL